MAPKRVLVIEDDPELVAVMTEVLAEEGYDVTSTQSALGAAALAARLHPDLIVLDLGLPYRSGASLLAEFKATASTADIPVLVVSGIAQTLRGQRRAMADAVLPKPFGIRELLATVHWASRPRGLA